MYSGFTLTRYSGRILGAHQKIDRVARRQLTQLGVDTVIFPGIQSILQFEGKNGPDGIKRKSPARDEPWHFYDPFGADDQIISLLEEHYQLLIKELTARNKERAAFEAAWLAHGIVDGLTPAHHYPYEAKLSELRGGAGNDSRTSIKAKLVMPGETASERIRNNWKMWGPKGLIISHGLFEYGIALIMAPLSFKEVKVTGYDISQLKKYGMTETFKRKAREVAILNMYDVYCEKGWTPRLAYDVRHKLGPILVKTVALVWYSALHDAGVLKRRGRRS